MTLPTPPRADIKPFEITTHGHTRVDNYYWLREKETPAVRTYLEAENAYTEEMTAHTKPLQETLYQEMVDRIQETDRSYPVYKEGYYYYTRTEAKKQYAIHCRKKESLDAPEEILVDENELAEGQPYFTLRLLTVSPDQRLLAYSTDTTGSERFTIYFKDLTTDELLPDQIPDTGFSAAWAGDAGVLTCQDC